MVLGQLLCLQILKLGLDELELLLNILALRHRNLGLHNLGLHILGLLILELLVLMLLEDLVVFEQCLLYLYLFQTVLAGRGSLLRN